MPAATQPPPSAAAGTGAGRPAEAAPGPKDGDGQPEAGAESKQGKAESAPAAPSAREDAPTAGEAPAARPSAPAGQSEQARGSAPADASTSTITFSCEAGQLVVKTSKDLSNVKFYDGTRMIEERNGLSGTTNRFTIPAGADRVTAKAGTSTAQTDALCVAQTGGGSNGGTDTAPGGDVPGKTSPGRSASDIALECVGGNVVVETSKDLSNVKFYDGARMIQEHRRPLGLREHRCDPGRCGQGLGQGRHHHRVPHHRCPRLRSPGRRRWHDARW